MHITYAHEIYVIRATVFKLAERVAEEKKDVDFVAAYSRKNLLHPPL
jgi:hypothetical protein